MLHFASNCYVQQGFDVSNIKMPKLDGSEYGSGGVMRKYWKKLAVASMVGAVVGLAAVYLLPKQWPASVLVQVGQAGTGAPLVDPASVVQRITFPDFLSHVLTVSGLPQARDKRSELVKKTLRATIARGTPLIEIRVEGYTPEDANKVATAALEIIQKEHAELLAPAVSRQQRSLAEIDDSLKIIQAERSKSLEAVTASSVSADKKFSENVLLASLIKSDDLEARNLREQRSALLEQLDPTRTFNTKAVTAIYVPPIPKSIPKGVGLILGGILGFALGVAYLLCINSPFRKRFYAILVGRRDSAVRAERMVGSSW